MGSAPISEHAEDAKPPHRILVRSLLKSRNKLRTSIASSRRIASGYRLRGVRLCYWFPVGQAVCLAVAESTDRPKQKTRSDALNTRGPLCGPAKPKKPGLTLHQEARERRIISKCETFHRNPAGNQSRPAEPGQQPGSESCVGAGDRHCEA